jgi:cell division protease FtsH
MAGYFSGHDHACTTSCPENRPIRRVFLTVNFVTALEEGRCVKSPCRATISIGTYKDDQTFKTFAPDDPNLVKELREKGVTIQAKAEEDGSFWMTMLVSWGPILLLIGVWIFFIRQMQSGGGKAMSFGKSRAKLLTDTGGQVTFKDVAGVDEAKDELEEIVFSKGPEKVFPAGRPHSPRGFAGRTTRHRQDLVGEGHRR